MSLVLLRTQSDERLVALARDGHERAFEAIVKRYRRPLLAACRRMVPEARAEDVLQQALVSAWRALRRGDEVRDLRAWLFRVARNTAISNLRGPGQLDPPELLDTLVAASSPQEEAERRAVVRETLEAVAGLPERQREALLRIAVQGHSQDEVAEELGVSRVAVRQLVHRARTAVRTAASAVVPFPVLTWLASAGSGDEPVSLRIAQLVAGAGGAGAGAALLKAGAVAGVAAGVTAPLLAEHRAPRTTPAHATPTMTTAPRMVPAASAGPAASATPRAIPVASIVPAKPRSTDPKPAAASGSGGDGASRQKPASPKRDDSAGDGKRRRGGDGASGGEGAVATPDARGDGETPRHEGDQAAKPATDSATRRRHDDGSSADEQSRSSEDQTRSTERQPVPTTEIQPRSTDEKPGDSSAARIGGLSDSGAPRSAPSDVSSSDASGD